MGSGRVGRSRQDDPVVLPRPRHGLRQEGSSGEALACSLIGPRNPGGDGPGDGGAEPVAIGVHRASSALGAIPDAKGTRRHPACRGKYLTPGATRAGGLGGSASFLREARAGKLPDDGGACRSSLGRHGESPDAPPHVLGVGNPGIRSRGSLPALQLVLVLREKQGGPPSTSISILVAPFLLASWGGGRGEGSLQDDKMRRGKSIDGGR